ncbi:MAG: ECF-type sigma factor [Phycisphaerales bacterium]
MLIDSAPSVPHAASIPAPALGWFRDDIYAALRALAAARLSTEPAGHTLQPTALVHEAFLKLSAQDRAMIAHRDHFLAVASQAMRRILVDHARKRRAASRSARGLALLRADFDAVSAPLQLDLEALDDALELLSSLNERQARVVELRYFGGLEVEHVARLLGVSEGTVKNDWRFARAWLKEQLDRARARRSEDAP